MSYTAKKSARTQPIRNVVLTTYLIKAQQHLGHAILLTAQQRTLRIVARLQFISIECLTHIYIIYNLNFHPARSHFVIVRMHALSTKICVITTQHLTVHLVVKRNEQIITLVQVLNNL